MRVLQQFSSYLGAFSGRVAVLAEACSSSGCSYDGFRERERESKNNSNNSSHLQVVDRLIIST